MKHDAYGWALKTVRTRPKADLTQQDLSRKTGITVGRLSRIEAGYAAPSEKELAAICKAVRYDRENLDALAEAGEPIVGAALCN